MGKTVVSDEEGALRKSHKSFFPHKALIIVFFYLLGFSHIFRFCCCLICADEVEFEEDGREPVDGDAVDDEDEEEEDGKGLDFFLSCFLFLLSFWFNFLFGAGFSLSIGQLGFWWRTTFHYYYYYFC